MRDVVNAIYGRKISDSIYERMSLCLPVSGYAPLRQCDCTLDFHVSSLAKVVP